MATALLRSCLLVVCFAFAAGLPGISSAGGGVYDGIFTGGPENHRYTFSDVPGTQSEALTDCRALGNGWDLATIEAARPRPVPSRATPEPRARGLRCPAMHAYWPRSG